MSRRLLLALGLAATVAVAIPQTRSTIPAGEVQFIFTSDAHYGITRPAFQGAANVDAHVVNAAMIAKINSLKGVTFPTDGGLRAGQPVGAVDFLAEGGDIANRSEGEGAAAIQSAARSWAQFRADYIEGLALTDRGGRKTPVFAVPGNHDVSNAVGFYKVMTPLIDRTSLVELYNYMMAPAVPKTTATYSYPRDRMLVSHDIGGIHFVFITMWPDSSVRAWLEQDLKTVSASTPVIIFTHDQPEAEAKHFTNPNGAHDINEADKFENLLVDQFADGVEGALSEERQPPTIIEQRALEVFLGRHPNITAYFHGNSNWSQFYDWTGPGHTIALHVVRADSPMKGHFSGADETKLSFQVATINGASRTMTVRECLWDTDPHNPSAAVAWGGSTTVALSPRP